jgi:hypothetical protein
MVNIKQLCQFFDAKTWSFFDCFVIRQHAPSSTFNDVDNMTSKSESCLGIAPHQVSYSTYLCVLFTAKITRLKYSTTVTDSWLFAVVLERAAGQPGV